MLFLTLGVVAMGLPLLNAVRDGREPRADGRLGTRVLDVVDWTPQLAAMIGIGVGIDYALLILNRFRLERAAGRDVRDATLEAIDTPAAPSVAGSMVVIAMLGMLLLGISFLYGPAIGAALAVLFTMFASLTLMPAILGTDRPADQAGRRTDGDADAADRESGFAARWSSFVSRRPLPVAVLALVVVIVLALAAPSHAPGDQRCQHVQGGRHRPGRLRQAQAGLRDGLQRPAAARGRAPAGGRRRGADADRRHPGRSGRDRSGPAAPAQRGRRHGDDDRLPETTPQDERTDEIVRRHASETSPR